MTADSEQDPARTALSGATIDLAIRLGFIALLGFWSLRVIAPVLTIGLWSAILAVVTLSPVLLAGTMVGAPSGGSTRHLAVPDHRGRPRDLARLRDAGRCRLTDGEAR